PGREADARRPRLRRRARRRAARARARREGLAARGGLAMDIFHNNAMLQGVRQMLGAFARQSIRPIAPIHDRDESMPWDLMKQAQTFGLTQTSVIDGRRALTGEEE